MNIEHFLVLLTRTSKACSWFSFFQIFFHFFTLRRSKNGFFQKVHFFAKKNSKLKTNQAFEGFFLRCKFRARQKVRPEFREPNPTPVTFFLFRFGLKQVLARTASWVSGTFVARVVWTCPEKEIPCSVITRERERQIKSSKTKIVFLSMSQVKKKQETLTNYERLNF